MSLISWMVSNVTSLSSKDSHSECFSQKGTLPLLLQANVAKLSGSSTKCSNRCDGNS